jgi:hypothetical protein
LRPKPNRGRISVVFRQLAVWILATLSLCGIPVAAAEASHGDGGDLEVRIRGKCSAGSVWRLRARAEDGKIEIEFRVEPRRRTGLWQIIVLHERRIALRRTLRAPSGGGSVELRTTVADWWGTDDLVIRATGPRNETCRAAATV